MPKVTTRRRAPTSGRVFDVLLDLLERALDAGDHLPDWLTVRRRLAGLVLLAEAPLAPAARGRLRAQLREVESHPDLYAVTLALALHGELLLYEVPPACTADAPAPPVPLTADQAAAFARLAQLPRAP